MLHALNKQLYKFFNFSPTMVTPACITLGTSNCSKAAIEPEFRYNHLTPLKIVKRSEIPLVIIQLHLQGLPLALHS